jgi:energy-coupling factor transport system permease protein
MQLMRAATAGMLDRALDAAAALEVRGYGAARAASPSRAPWSRHDAAFAASAILIAGLAVAGQTAGWAPLHAYPALHAPVGTDQILLAAGMMACALAPFADRRGIER